MMKTYDCATCGYELQIQEGGQVTCPACGTPNYFEDLKNAELLAKEQIEQMLGEKLEEIQMRLGTTADTAARDYMFKKDFKPRIDTAFQDLLERFEEHFRRPIFQVRLLVNYNKNFDVNKIFESEDGKLKGWSDKVTTKDLKTFGKELLGQPVMGMLAASESSQNHIKTLEKHAMFLTYIYAARGKALTLNAESMTYAKNLIIKAKNAAMELAQLYQKASDGMLQSVNFNAWAVRLTLNETFAEILKRSFEGDIKSVYPYYEQLINETDKKIEEFRKLNEADEKSYPLYFIISIIEGLNVDLQIYKLFQKLSSAMMTAGITYDMNVMLQNLDEFLKISSNDFNAVRLQDWDPDWINKLEERLQRAFQLIDNIVELSQIRRGEKQILLLDENPVDVSEWQPNAIIPKKSVEKRNISLPADVHVKQRIDLLLPIAYINAYIIAGKGFWFRKAGEDFEAPLFCNPYFRLDPLANDAQYSNALSYLFIPEEKEGKKIKDPLELYILDLIEKIEGDQRKAAPSGVHILPLINTQKEIEEFVMRSYDLLSKYEDLGTEPHKDFKKGYKDIKIEKNFESLSGELVDYIYIPATLFQLAYGVEKKGDFQPKGDYKWLLLTPFNTDAKNPFNDFMKIQLDPMPLFPLIELTDKLFR